MKFIFLIFLVFSFSFSNAQTVFLTQGRVEYEKKVNQFKSLEEDEDGDNEWIKELKKTMPRFVNDVYELHFSQTKSAYHLKAENTENKYL